MNVTALIMVLAAFSASVAMFLALRLYHRPALLVLIGCASLCVAAVAAWLAYRTYTGMDALTYGASVLLRAGSLGLGVAMATLLVQPLRGWLSRRAGKP
jgi:NADPH:quinone reductase-like Zn-dependent oxidoreductase